MLLLHTVKVLFSFGSLGHSIGSVALVRHAGVALDRKYHFLPSIALVRQVLEVLHMIDNVFLASVALVRQKSTKCCI